MSVTTSIGYTNVGAVGAATINTTIQFTSDTLQGTNTMVYAEENANSPQAVVTVVSNAALQNVTVPTGATGVLVSPPQPTELNSNAVLTSLRFGVGNSVFSISPTGTTRIGFDTANTANIPAVVSVTAIPANLALQLIFP